MRLLGVSLLLLLMTSPAMAQDYLGTHLDNIRDDALRGHQQDMVTDRPGERRTRTGRPTTSSQARVSQADRQAAWARNKAEYRRRMVRDGPAAADRWLDRQARLSSSTRTTTSRTNRAGADTRNCKRIRWVNRATPGFGGGPMTMSRVAVCAN